MTVAPETTVQPASEPAPQPPGGSCRRNQQEATIDDAQPSPIALPRPRDASPGDGSPDRTHAGRAGGCL